ncbi:MAG: hypothetical protein N2749_02630 [Clostridia bacterium]|nr:hypothetical protein [Clostridia bacterium]
MWILIFLVVLFLILIFVTLFSTLIAFVTKLVTRYNYNNKQLIIPAILFLLLWSTLALLFCVVIKSIYNIDIFNLLFNNIMYFNENTISNNKVIITALIIVIFGIIIQSLVFLSLNINYMKLYRKFFKKVNENATSNQLIVNQDQNISFINALVCSLFMFSIIFFCLLVFLSIGNIVSNKVLEKI